MIARAIHRLSGRQAAPFVAINCGAIPENLLESELFGHEKGAFTSAHVQRKGRIESAQGGTLFLDEIGELPLALQVKLLHFLQEQRIERVGGREEISVNVRVIAATNKNLTKAIEEGVFREDLFYRLQVVTITVPPLREREGDVVLLAETLVHVFGAELNRKIMGITPRALRMIREYDWPGNVRELENRIKRAVVMAQGSRITGEDLELENTTVRSAAKTLKEVRESVERDAIRGALAKYRGNISKTAVNLGISRPTLYELLARYGIAKS
jgi:two-component system NtrC family response regulator